MSAGAGARSPPRARLRHRPSTSKGRPLMGNRDTASIHRTDWHDRATGRRENGVMIRRLRYSVFVPDGELLNLANQIADHLAGIRHRTRSETR